MIGREIQAARTRLITILLLFAFWCAVCARLFGATTNRLYLTWDNDPDYDTNVTFYVYSQTNVALPLAGWVVATNVSYSSWTNNPARKPDEVGVVELPATLDRQRFYVVTASNIFGESDFSNPVSTRRLLPGRGLRIGAF